MKIKKLVLNAGLLLGGASAFAQNGLDSVFIEKYYISDANDAQASTGGFLPIGSVTYRIFVDMKPGYKFQALYGVPNHELRLSTTTEFFNNEDRGNTTPTYTKNQMRDNTVMLDSWFSVGAASGGTGANSNFGVLKSDDDGVGTVVNSEVPPLLQNADPAAGIPLTQEDGMIAGTATEFPKTVTFVGLNTELNIFNDGSANGNLFTTNNASIASLTGSVGQNPTTNRVLIGQFTTDGIFCYKLNIQIGTPSGGVENYVAENPQNNEVLLSSLNGCLDPMTFITGLDKMLSTKNIKLFPNPARNKIFVEFKTESSKNNSYSIFNVEGKLMLQKTIEDNGGLYQENIDLSGFRPGIYFVELNSNGKTSHLKFVKE